MEIVKKLTDRRVRADSLANGDGFVDSGASVYRIISSNSCNLKVTTRLEGFLPKVLVDNLSTSTLGWFKRGSMVTPVNLELIVTERN